MNFSCSSGFERRFLHGLLCLVADFAFLLQVIIYFLSTHQMAAARKNASPHNALKLTTSTLCTIHYPLSAQHLGFYLFAAKKQLIKYFSLISFQYTPDKQALKRNNYRGNHYKQKHMKEKMNKGRTEQGYDIPVLSPPPEFQ